MPIAAAYSPINSQMYSAWSMGKGATVSTSTNMFVLGIGTSVPMGMIYSGVTLVPLTPTGISAAQSMMTAALSMGSGATVSTTSKQMAQAIALIAPLCPPAGYSALSSLIEVAMSSGKGAQVNTVCQQIAQGVITYYTSGGVI